jgi:hypothetical protein
VDGFDDPSITRMLSMGDRPKHVKPPAHLSPSPPVPAPEPVKQERADPLGLDPTRYGDWALKGIAVDF